MLAKRIPPAVLVVDDDLAIRETLRLALEDSQYSVLEATDGQEALDLLRASETSLVVLLDQFMPVLDGLSVLADVITDSRLRDLHGYLIMTASPQSLPPTLNTLDERLLLQTLAKPFDIDDLLNAVRAMSDRVYARIGATDDLSTGEG